MLRRLALLPLTAAVLASCGPNPKARELRLWSDNYAFHITMDSMPPRALEPIEYRVVVQDKKTGQPIETGEGRIFATSADRAKDAGQGKQEEDFFHMGTQLAARQPRCPHETWRCLHVVCARSRGLRHP